MIRIKYLLILTGILNGITSCNPVGEKVDTIICEEEYINSSAPVSLKKGDKLAIWFETTGVVKEEEEENKEEGGQQENISTVGINIQLKDQSVYYEKIRVLPVRPMINTSYDKKTGFLEKYETLAHTYTATENGEYSVDTKLYHAVFGQDVAVVVRKK